MVSQHNIETLAGEHCEVAGFGSKATSKAALTIYKRHFANHLAKVELVQQQVLTLMGFDDDRLAGDEYGEKIALISLAQHCGVARNAKAFEIFAKQGCLLTAEVVKQVLRFYNIDKFVEKITYAPKGLDVRLQLCEV